MQSLKLKPFSDLIPLLPVEKHAVRVKASNWEDHFIAAGLSADFKNIFGISKDVRITRKDILTQSHKRRKCIEILLWGYPSGIRGNYHLDYLNNIEEIATQAASQASWPDYFDELNGLGGLGISTVTKIAYFFSRTFKGHKALILDNRLIGVMVKSGWKELSKLNHLTYGNAVKNYVCYLEVIKRATEGTNASPEQIEFFLFSLGDTFNQNLQYQI